MDSRSQGLINETIGEAITVALGIAGSVVQGAIEGAARVRYARWAYDHNVQTIRVVRIHAKIPVSQEEEALLRKLADLQARPRGR